MSKLLEMSLLTPIAELSVSICSTPKIICSSDDGVGKLLISENDMSYESKIYKSRMIRTIYLFKIEFIINTYLKVKGK